MCGRGGVQKHVDVMCHAHIRLCSRACMWRAYMDVCIYLLTPVYSHILMQYHAYLHDDQAHDDPERVGAALSDIIAELRRLFLERALDVLLSNVLLLLQQLCTCR